MHLLDTDTLTYLHAGHPRVVERLHNLADPDVGTTIITKIEVLRGRFEFVLKAATGTELVRAQQLLTRTEELLAQILIIPIGEASAVQFDHLRAVKKLKKIGRADVTVQVDVRNGQDCLRICHCEQSEAISRLQLPRNRGLLRRSAPRNDTP